MGHINGNGSLIYNWLTITSLQLTRKDLGDTSELNQKIYIRKFMNETLENICDVLRDLVPFAQFKKQPWKSVTLVKL